MKLKVTVTFTRIYEVDPKNYALYSQKPENVTANEICNVESDCFGSDPHEFIDNEDTEMKVIVEEYKDGT